MCVHSAGSRMRGLRNDNDVRILFSTRKNLQMRLTDETSKLL